MAMDMNRYRSKKAAINSYVLAAIIIVLVFVTIGFIGIGRYLEATRKSCIKHYCYGAKLSYYEPYVDKIDYAYLNGSRQTSNFSYKSLESKKYKDEQKMIESLPGSFSQALKDAVNNGQHEEASDLDGNPVTRYYVPANLLPLDPGTSAAEVEHYYFVYKYYDGSYRFAILVEVTDIDY